MRVFATMLMGTISAGIFKRKNAWSDQVWNDVKFHIFHSHYRWLSLRLQITRMKIVHNQLPLGKCRLTNR